MDKFTFIIGVKTVEFGIGSRKYLFGNDKKTRFAIQQTLSQTFSKTKDSEYAMDRGLSRRILINDEAVPLKRYFFHKVTPHFDLSDDLKLKSNSLINRYLSHKLKNIEYTEEFNTLSLLFRDFADQIDSGEDMKERLNLEIEMIELNVKNLIKLMQANLVIEEEPVNVYDLCYENLINFQLNIIRSMAEIDYETTYLVYLDIPFMTEAIRSNLVGSQADNLKVIVDTDTKPPNALEEILFINEKTLDLANEEELYNHVTLNMPSATNIEETKALIRQYLTDEKTENYPELRQILQ